MQTQRKHPDRSADCWLLVWEGDEDWETRVAQILGSVQTISPDAHHILSREIDGERWSLLLVHYLATERDAIVSRLKGSWEYGFVNAVWDLES